MQALEIFECKIPYAWINRHITTKDNDTAGLRRRVFAILEEAVLNGKYKNGESLTESRLAGELGVSRTPIREALTQLENEGLVQLVPNKGAVVTGISPKDIQDIYTIRIMIEGLAARWAAKTSARLSFGSSRRPSIWRSFIRQREISAGSWALIRTFTR